jgi:hypothetical protein
LVIVPFSHAYKADKTEDDSTSKKSKDDFNKLDDISLSPYESEENEKQTTNNNTAPKVIEEDRKKEKVAVKAVSYLKLVRNQREFLFSS